MATEYIKAYRKIEGYNGRTIICHAVFDTEACCLLEVHAHGFHRSSFLSMGMLNATEAKWLIEHHPLGKKYYLPV